MIDAILELLAGLALLSEWYQHTVADRIESAVDELDDHAPDKAFADRRSDAFFTRAQAELERGRDAGAA